MTHLSFTAATDFGVSCGLPLYLAVEVAESVIGDEDFAPESLVLAAVEVALRDIDEYGG